MPSDANCICTAAEVGLRTLAVNVAQNKQGAVAMKTTKKKRLTKSERSNRIDKAVSFVFLAIIAVIWAFSSSI